MESCYLRFFLFLFFYFSLWKEIKGVNFAPFSFSPPPLPSFWIRFIARWLGFFSIRRNESLYFQWNVRTQPSLMLLTTACNRIYLFPLSMQEYTHFKEHLRLAIPVGRRVNFISLRWMSRKAARVTSKTIVRLYFTFRRKRDLCHVIRIIQYSFLIKKKKSHSHSYILHFPSLSLYSYYFFLRNSLYIFFFYSTDFIPTGVSRVRKINFFAGRMS